MDIFIGILFICFNESCYFMQSKTQFETEQECVISVEQQKANILILGGVAEGTCISVEQGLRI